MRWANKEKMLMPSSEEVDDKDKQNLDFLISDRKGSPSASGYLQIVALVVPPKRFQRKGGCCHRDTRQFEV